MKILNTPWRWFFFVSSLLARLPLSMVPVVVLLGALDSGATIGAAGLLLGAIAIGAGVTGLLQGPAWDRFNNSALYLLLSVLAAAALIGLALLPIAGTLTLALGAAYGLLRPQSSTVIRNAWIEEFRDDAELSAKSVSLDVTASPVLNVIGPILAGALFAALGYQGATGAIAALGLIAAVLLSLALQRLAKRRIAATGFSLLGSARRLFLHSPLVTIFAITFVVTVASGAFSVILSAQLNEVGHISWLSGLLAVNALGIIIGAPLFRRISRAPASYLHLLLLGESIGLIIFALVFSLPPIFLWFAIPVGALFVAPLSTTLYMVVEARAEERDRSAAFSLLASIQFAGVALGQVIFAQLAEYLGPSAAVAIGALVVASSVLIWAVLPYGMKRYRPATALAWWPEDLGERCLKITTLSPAEAERQYGEIISYIAKALDAGTVPDLPRSLRYQSQTPEAIVILSRMAWSRVFASGSRRNNLIKALRCGQWYADNGLPESAARASALHFGFQYRFSANPPGDQLPEEWVAASGAAQRFAALYCLSVLRSGRRFRSALEWLARPELQTYSSEPIFEALGLLSRLALGETRTGEDFERLWGQLVDSEKHVLLDALNLSLGHDRQRANLLLESIARYKNEVNQESSWGVVNLYAARAYRILGDTDQARRAVLEAYETLTWNASSEANSIFIEQMDVERLMIEASSVESDPR